MSLLFRFLQTHKYQVMNAKGFVGAFSTLTQAADVCVTRQDTSLTRDQNKLPVAHWVEHGKVVYNYIECLGLRARKNGDYA
jgi:hypothetical protein